MSQADTDSQAETQEAPVLQADEAQQVVAVPANPDDPIPEFAEMENIRRAVEEGKEPGAAQVAEDEGAAKPDEAGSKQEQPDAEGGKPDADETKQDEEPGDELERLRREIRKRDGKYGSEKQQLTARIDALERQLQDAAQAKPAAPAPEKAKDAPAPDADPTDEDLKATFGDDFEEFMGRDYAARLFKANQRQLASRERQIFSKVEEVVQAKLGGIKAQDALERTISAIEKSVPNVRDLDANAEVNGFAAYLDEEHADTGFTRREVAERAMASIRNGAVGSDYDRAKTALERLFRGFSGGGKADDGSEAQEQTAGAKAGRPNPRSFAMPSTSKADRTPKMGDSMTTDQVDDALRKAEREGNLDAVIAKVFKKAAQNEVVPA